MKQKLEQAILQQDIPEIEACLTRYEACNPTDFDLFSYKISLALLKEDFQAAYDLAKTAITLNPFDVEANYNFMVCARSLGKYAVAYQSFLMIQFVQMRYRITVINDETLAVWEQEFQILAAEDTDLENEFSVLSKTTAMPYWTLLRIIRKVCVEKYLPVIMGNNIILGLLTTGTNHTLTFRLSRIQFMPNVNYSQLPISAQNMTFLLTSARYWFPSA